MSDVREELAEVMHRAYSDATPKPAISDEQLGEWLTKAHDEGQIYFDARGKALLLRLEQAGLTIVRIEDPTPTGRVS